MNSNERGSGGGPAGRSSRRLELGSWVGVSLAFSPVLAQLAAAIASHPEHRHAVLGWLLLLLAVRRGQAEPAVPRVAGLGLAALGALLEVAGIASGSWSLARLGLPVAVCGLAIRFGRPPLCTALLSVWVLPLPTTVLRLLEPLSIHSYLAELSAKSFAALGAPFVVVGRAVHTPDAILDITARPGWVLAYVLAGIGWYSVARSGGSLRRALARASAWALCALPLQAVAILVATGLLWLSGPKLALAWLYEGTWLAATLVGLVLVERRQRRRPEATQV